MVASGIRADGSGAEPHVPVEVFGDRSLGGTTAPLRPHWPVGPDVEFLDAPEVAPLDEGRRLAERVGGRPLVAHLRRHLLAAGDLAHQSGFGDRLREWLLAEAGLAEIHRRHGGHDMGVVGRADGDSVDLLPHLLEHLAEVRVGLRSLEGSLGTLQLVGIDVGNRDDLARTAGVSRVALPLAADADTREADLLIGPLRALRPNLGGDEIPGRHGGGGRGGCEELTAGRSETGRTTAGHGSHSEEMRAARGQRWRDSQTCRSEKDATD